MAHTDIQIPNDQFQELLRIYNGFHGAFDPTDPAVMEAQRAFVSLLGTLHEAHARSVPFAEFRRFAAGQCKLYLRKN